LKIIDINGFRIRVFPNKKYSLDTFSSTKNIFSNPEIKDEYVNKQRRILVNVFLFTRFISATMTIRLEYSYIDKIYFIQDSTVITIYCFNTLIGEFACFNYIMLVIAFEININIQSIVFEINIENIKSWL